MIDLHASWHAVRVLLGINDKDGMAHIESSRKALGSGIPLFAFLVVRCGFRMVCREGSFGKPIFEIVRT